MKHLSLKKTVIVALVLLQFTTIVHSQAASGAATGGDVVAQPADVESNLPVSPAVTDPVVNPPVDPTVAPPVVVPSSTTEEPKPTANPTTTTAPVTTPEPKPPAASSDPVVPPAESSNPTNPNPQPSNQETNSNNNPNTKPTNTGASAKPTASSDGGAANTETPGNTGSGKKDEGETNKTAIIAGSVVGGLVGIALIAGLLTWLNRRGGCTSRTRRRDIQDDFDAHDNAYDLKMTESHNMGAVAAGAGGGMAATSTGGGVHSSDNLPPPAPFQHARRFVPPTSNPTGYMNLTDEEYGYHQQNTAYQPQPQPQGAYQEYNNNSEYDYQQQQHPEYAQHEYQQEYRNEYGQQQQDYIPHHDYVNEYQHEGSTNGGSANANGAGYQQAYYHTSSNVTSPTLTNTVPAALNDPYRQQLKPDQIEQKPNAA